MSGDKVFLCRPVVDSCVLCELSGFIGNEGAEGIEDFDYGLGEGGVEFRKGVGKVKEGRKGPGLLSYLGQREEMIET